jgi:hypothetical protein
MSRPEAPAAVSAVAFDAPRESFSAEQGLVPLGLAVAQDDSCSALFNAA